MAQQTIILMATLCALLPMPALAQTPSAGDREQASRHFDRGLEQIEQRAYADAVVQFERAYELSGDTAVLHNLGMAYAAAGRPVEAATALARYLQINGDALSAPERARVAAELERQRALYGHVAIQVEPAGAWIKVDGREVGVAPLAEPLPLPIGKHRIEASLAGYDSSSWVVNVASGPPAALLMALRPTAVASAAPAAREVPLAAPPIITPAPPVAVIRKSDGRAQRIVGYAIGAAGLASAIAAVSLVVVSGDRFDDWEREDEALEPLRAATDEDSEQRRKQNDALLKSIWQMDALSWALGIGGGALVAGGAIVLWTASDEDEHPPAAQLSLRGNGFSLAGRF